MQLQIDKLGKVAVTVEQDYWSNVKDYDKLTIVQAASGDYNTYISRIPVPAGTPLTNRTYWIPFSSIKEEIVLDYNTFVNLWTNALNSTNEHLDRVETQLNTDVEEIYKAIASVVAGGVALKQGFGDSEVYGISQKVLTEKIDEIQDKIDRLHPSSAVFTVVATPNIIYDNTQNGFSVTAKMTNNSIADSISITVNGNTQTIERASVFTINGNVSHRADIQAQAVQNGLTYEASTVITAVDPYYIGAGTQYEDILNDTYKQSIKASPAGTYTVSVATTGNFVFFVIPQSMGQITASMGGFDFPLDTPQTIQHLDKPYRVYKSSNPMDAGTYSITVKLK